MKNRHVLYFIILAWVTAFILIPIGTMFLYSFWSVEEFKIVREFSLNNFAVIFKDPLYIPLFIKTFKMAFIISICSTILSYPMAIFVHNYGGKFKTILYISVLAPLWVGYLVRIYSWRSILGENGFFNSILISLGILDEPSSAFLFNSFAVIITMLCIAIPFTFIPIYNAIEKIPNNLTQAATDLGANNHTAFWSVIFPLSLPGVITGFLLAFVISYGDYLTPALVGGPSGIMIGSVIQSQFGNSFNWPLGAALAVIMLIFILIILAVAQKLGDVKGTFEE